MIRRQKRQAKLFVMRGCRVPCLQSQLEDLQVVSH